MNSGIYTAYSGLQAQMNALDIVANNLANVATPGFKEEKPFFTVLAGELNKSDGDLSRAINSQAVLSRGAMLLRDGSLVLTNRDLDVALTGEGFLCVRTPNGERLTRNGSLNLNSASVLSTADGFPVLGESGPINLGPGKIAINGDGDVLLDGTRVDRLKLRSVENAGLLQHEGNSLLVATDGPAAKPARLRVHQGYLEQSNVNPIISVVGLVNIMRQFESIQKSMNLLANEINSKSIEKLSR